MKTTILIAASISTFLLSTGHAAVVKNRDSEESCTLYRVINSDSSGKINLNNDEVIVDAKDAYGLTFQDMEVNFDTREVLVQPMINIILGFNRPLTTSKAVIPSTHPDFNFLINQVNRKLFVFEKVCITDDNKIAYATLFENK
jgi:hypothetical protein